ncbi:MAG: type B 50S ribosomal protein L31 [Bifidobacterium sp.]|jgi:large subunit ribosomal protein L31|nr:type B 50S ribosomal protein L31 [Bifidobacterium sp.]MCI1865896.1 type B 50S ribosomal protein L31 [Bifidobacterium sp.]
MKKDIHPIYDYVVFHDSSSDRSFLTKSTLAAKAASLPSIVWEDGRTYPLVNVEVSSYSHPFYTGRSMVLDTEGQVQKFNARYGRTTAPRGAARTQSGHGGQA